jgi:hypothetical protein
MEGLEARRWLREVCRDPRFCLSLLVIGAFIVAAVVNVAKVAAAFPLAGLALATVAGFAIYRASFIAPGSARRRDLETGILHPWIAFGPALKRWVLGRAAVLTIFVCALLTVIIGVARPDLAWPGILGMAGGAAVAAATAGLTFRRRIGAVPVWLLNIGLWALATPASALATHNNPGAPIGLGMITGVGLICGLGLAWPNLRLVRFLAFHPVPLRRIAARLCGPQVGLVAVLAVMAAIGGGQPVGLALASAAIVVAGVCVWLVLLVPYAMTRSVGAAPMMAGSELFVAAVVKFAFQFGAIAMGWLIFRAIGNIRAIRRNRWREPL